MKTLIFFLSTIFTFNCYGQVQHTNNTLSERNRIQRNKHNGSCSYDNPAAHIKKLNFLNTKLLAWTWDTIIAYNTLNAAFERQTQVFAPHGNVLITLTEQWQTNAWVNSYRDTYTYDANGNSITGKYETWQANWHPNSFYLYLYSNKNVIYGVNCYRYQASYKSFNSGIPEIAANSSLIVYPNPSNGSVTLQYELPKNETEGELILYNMQGTEVKRYKVDNTFKDILLDNTQLPAGTYFYQLQTKKGAVGTKKMVVVK